MNERMESLLELSKRIINIENINALLDQLLYETRRACNADAASIFLVENSQLRFSYVQNYSLGLNKPNSRKQLYIDQLIPINLESIAGYVASTGEQLNIPDVSQISSESSYHYNDYFDRQTGYRTRSMVTTPLHTPSGQLIGVLQLINSEQIDGFSEMDCGYLTHASEIAARAIERARISNEIFMRMLRMAELRDPKETGAHVKRVGAYTVELYDAWARKHNISDQEIRLTKDPLHTAAMLHDIGKVAISDNILKKPAKLDKDEFAVMQTHTSIGADLFEGSTLTLDKMSQDIIQCHHERWDGGGYPNGLKGEAIPLVARIVALADVYDALCSKRVYKDAWAEEAVLDYFREQAGEQFDPELVELFLSIQEVIQKIRNRYQG